MAYRAIKNMETATGWGDVQYGEPVPAELSYNAITKIWKLTVKGVTIDVSDWVSNDIEEGVGLIDVSDMVLTKAGHECVKSLGFGHLLH
jgi:hypothetical protein